MDDRSPSVDAQRIASLETLVRALHAEVGSLRDEVRALRAATPNAPEAAQPAGSPATRPSVRTGDWATPPATEVPPRASSSVPPPPPPPPPPARPRVPPRAPLDLEKLVGRYATIALATLVILMGVGAFLQWAIARGWLGPAVRVILGAIAALVLAGLGIRLRRGPARRFGNILLALALAVVHLDAWAAGPVLHVVSSVTALICAAAASLVLAGLAITEEEQSLFVVGVGGALAAPFVTSEGGGRIVVLLTYGWVIITGAVIALRGREWWLPGRMLVAGALAYAGGALGAVWTSATRVERDAPSAFVLACALSTLTLGDAADRRILTRAFLTVMLVPLFLRGGTDGTAVDIALLAAAATTTVYASLLLKDEEGLATLFDTLVLPLAFLAAALVALPATVSTTGALVALGWAGAAALASMAPGDGARAPHLATAGVAVAVALMLGLDYDHVAETIALAILAAATGLLVRRERALIVMLPGLVAALAATLRAWDLLHDRPAYLYAPFVTTASLAALATTAGWLAFGRLAASTEFRPTPLSHPERAVLGSLGAIAGFFWGREELGRAWSAEMSTFLLIFYYAASGVIAIGLGRLRGITGARRIGLALCVYAAVKAIAEASGLDAIGLKVASFLLVGVFLLGVGYWYRASAREERADAADAPPDGQVS